MLESLAKHYAFDIEAPFESLPTPVQHAILHGSGDEEIAFSYIMDSGASKGKVHTKKHPFEGILPNMARRYRETDSVVVREDLARYRSTQPCPECHGVRLRREARHVKVGEGTQARAIYEVSHATLSDAHAWFKALTLTGAKAEIADKVVREIATRLQFLNDVGLSYLSLDRSGRDTLRRRGAAHSPGFPNRLGPHGRDVCAGRAQHRPAPARQRPAHRHTAAPARHRQQRDRGRARRRHDARRRPGDRHGPRRWRAWRGA